MLCPLNVSDVILSKIPSSNFFISLEICCEWVDLGSCVLVAFSSRSATLTYPSIY